LSQTKYKVFLGIYTEMFANEVKTFKKNMKSNLASAYIELIKKFSKDKKVEEESITDLINAFNKSYEDHRNKYSG
jgi:hypothetical protein